MTFVMPSHIDVDGLALDGITDANGVTWGFSSIDGWHDGPGVNTEQTQRIVTHGQFGQVAHRTGRVVTIGGFCFADNRVPMWNATAQIAAVLADGDFGTLSVTDDNGLTLTAAVQLLDKPDVDWPGKDTARFQLSLLAPDPYRYGASSSGSTGLYSGDAGGIGLVFDLFSTGDLDFGVGSGSTGVITLANAGTAPAAVTHSVAGPTPSGGFYIVQLSTGKRITYLGPVVPSGSTIVFDSADASVVIDDVADRSGDTIVQDWHEVPAGASSDFLFQSISASSAAVLTSSLVATYW